MTDFEAVETLNDNHVGGWVPTTDGTKLWVDVHGRGRPIVLVHGWTVSSAFWRRQIVLSEEFQVITIDLRGHGRSRSVLRGHTLARYAQDLHNAFFALDIHDALLLGWSMGGAVALDYWQHFNNDRISALGIVETAPAPASCAPWNTHYCRNNDMNAMRASIEAMKTDRKAYASRFVNAMFLSGNAPSHALKWMVEEQMKTNATTAAAIYENYVNQDYTPVLPTITIPTIAIYGRSQHMCYGPSTGRYVAGSVPDSRFVILDKSGHLPFYEEAALFNNELRHFMNQLS